MSRRGRAPADFAVRIMQWQAAHGRNGLPWQGTRDPYRIWLSEIMLQQTQVATVIPYYARFLVRFPDIAALAAASADEVMANWSGLGYYSRARNLHRAAQEVVARFGAVFPREPADIESLPGIGRSTAAAIAAFAYGARAAILDGNVKRVFARHFGIDGFPGERKVEAALWTLAESLLPADGIERYTQGLMDLGATLCTTRAPRCARCPLAATCVALATDRVAALPVPRPKRVLPLRRTSMLVMVDGERVLLERRPPAGIWGGLWSFPEVAAERPDADDVLAATGVTARGIRRLARLRHGFTHYTLDIDAFVASATVGARAASSQQRWFTRDEALAAGLPAPARRLLEAFATPSLLAQDAALPEVPEEDV